MERNNIDPIGGHNWDKNDTWAQQVIIHNVTSSQMNHVGDDSGHVSAMSATQQNTTKN
jgi:hypothetical protein